MVHCAALHPSVRLAALALLWGGPDCELPCFVTVWRSCGVPERCPLRRPPSGCSLRRPGAAVGEGLTASAAAAELYTSPGVALFCPRLAGPWWNVKWSSAMRLTCYHYLKFRRIPLSPLDFSLNYRHVSLPNDESTPLRAFKPLHPGHRYLFSAFWLR